jgi:hypothetical protein
LDLSIDDVEKELVAGVEVYLFAVGGAVTSPIGLALVRCLG